MIRRPPRSTLSSSSAASDVYKRQRISEENQKCDMPSPRPHRAKRRRHHTAVRGHAASGRSRPTPHLTATTPRCHSHRRFRLQRGKAAFATFPNLWVQWTQDAPVPSSLFESTRPQDRATLTKQASRERWTGHAGQDYRRLGRGGGRRSNLPHAPRPQALKRCLSFERHQYRYSHERMHEWVG